MPTVAHPTLPITKEVADSQVERWTRSGWQVTEGDTPTVVPTQPPSIAVLQCPTCAQTGYQPCVTASGTVRKDYHKARTVSGSQTSVAATAADQGQHSDEGEGS